MGGPWGAPSRYRELPYFLDHLAAASLSTSKSRQKRDLGLSTLNTKGSLDNTSDSWPAGLNFESLEASREKSERGMEAAVSSVPGTARGGPFLFGSAGSSARCGLCVLGLGLVLAPHGHL